MIKINSTKIQSVDEKRPKKVSKKEGKKRIKRQSTHIFKNNTQFYRQMCQTINWIITDIKITAGTDRTSHWILRQTSRERSAKRTSNRDGKKNLKGLTQPSTVKQRNFELSLCAWNLFLSQENSGETRNFKQEKNVNRMIVNQRWFFSFFFHEKYIKNKFFIVFRS